jgi:hypothetical protein
MAWSLAGVETRGEGWERDGREERKRQRKKEKLWGPQFGGEDGGPPGMEVEMRNLEGYAK